MSPSELAIAERQAEAEVADLPTALKTIRRLRQSLTQQGARGDRLEKLVAIQGVRLSAVGGLPAAVEARQRWEARARAAEAEVEELRRKIVKLETEAAKRRSGGG